MSLASLAADQLITDGSRSSISIEFELIYVNLISRPPILVGSGTAWM